MPEHLSYLVYAWQVEMHPNWRNERVLQYCKQKNIHVTAYAPMSSPGTMAKSGRKVPNLQKVGSDRYIALVSLYF